MNKQLEKMRTEQKLGSSLEAQVELALPKDFFNFPMSQQELCEFFSVSQVKIQEGAKISVQASFAKGDKCLRCWFYSESLNEEQICLKCQENLK